MNATLWSRHTLKKKIFIYFIFVSIREFTINPLCNLDVHPLDPPTEPSTHLHQVAVVNHPQGDMGTLS